MSERKNFCILIAELVGEDQLVGRISAAEAKHAIERCMHRLDRAAASLDGSTIQRDNRSATISFERCDSAVLAACEILERINSLPPLSGARLSVRIGLHYDVLDPGESDGTSIQTTQRLAQLCQPGQALASGTVVVQLSSATRHFAGNDALQDSAFTNLEWPVYAIGQRLGIVTSIPPTARVSQRLRLRHQQEIVFVEEQRPVVLLGRELGNDLVIIDPRASRQHARIEKRREGFVLIDQSTNGTYVFIDGASEQCIKQAEHTLIGPGRIGCGFSANEVERDLVFFDIA